MPWKTLEKNPGENRAVKRRKNREDGSKSEDFQIKSIASTQTMFRNIFQRTSKRTNETNETNEKLHCFDKFLKNLVIQKFCHF